MRTLRSLVMALALCAALAAPFAVFAADTSPLQEGWSLYPEACKCEGSAPDFKCVGEVIRNMVNLAIAVGVVIFVLVASYAGVLFMASSVNPRGKEQAKSMLTSAGIGLVTALAAWLIVDFIMGALYNDKAWGPWNSILSNPDAEYCLVQRTEPGATIGTGSEPTFSSGDLVECNIVPARPNDYYPGRVTSSRVVDDGNPATPSADMVTVAFEGNTQEGNPIGSIEIVASECRPRAGASEPLDAGDVAVGDRLECYLTTDTTYYPGSVTALKNNGATLTMNFDSAQDGDVPLSHCRDITATAGDGDLSGITLSIGSNAVVSENAKTELKQILSAAGLTSATITSGRRTPEDQARIMEENLHNGVRINYAAAGDAVTAVYDRLRAEGKSRAEIRAGMLAEINRQGCSNVSKHCTTQDVIDVSPGSIANRSAFERAVTAHGVSRFLKPGQEGEQTYHIEF